MTAARGKRIKAHKFSLDHRGEFDEVFVSNAHVHIERMNETGYWIGIDSPGKPRLMLNTGVYRGEWFFNISEDGGQGFSVTRPRSKKRVAGEHEPTPATAATAKEGSLRPKRRTK